MFCKGRALEPKGVKKLALTEAPELACSKQAWVNASELRKSR